MKPKMFFHKHLWRIQNVKGIYANLIWSFTLSMALYSYISHGLTLFLGVDNVILHILLLTAALFGFTFAIGMLYDKGLKLWQYRAVVGQERNPYAKQCLRSKEIVKIYNYQIPKLREKLEVLNSLGLENDVVTKELESCLSMYHNWVEFNFKMDQGVRGEVKALMNRVT